jgi:hypothetical protein
MDKAPVPESWYSLADPKHYHNHPGCHVGQQISKPQRLAGDGRRRLCPVCRELNEPRPRGGGDSREAST